MSDWIGLAVIAFVILCVVFGFSRLSKPYDISNEEFERRAQEGPGLLGAGLVGLQKALDPAMQKAVEAQEDLRQGRYDGEQGSGASGCWSWQRRQENQWRTRCLNTSSLLVAWCPASEKDWQRRRSDAYSRLVACALRLSNSILTSTSIRHHVAVPTRRSFYY